MKIALLFLILSTSPTRLCYLQAGSFFGNETSLHFTASVGIQARRGETLRVFSRCAFWTQAFLPLGVNQSRSLPPMATQGIPQHGNSDTQPFHFLLWLTDQLWLKMLQEIKKTKPLSARLLIKLNKLFFGLLQHFHSNLCHSKAVYTILSAISAFT